MKATETESKQTNRRYAYTKVRDARKHPIRGLYRRNGKYLARITVEEDSGKKAVKWVTLEGASTPSEAQEAMRVLLVERSENRLRHIGQTPKLADYITGTYLPRLETSGKKPDTIVTEKGHLNRWAEAVGGLYLDKIRPFHVTNHLQTLKEKGKADRTCNLALVILRSVLKSARMDGFIKTLPVEGIPWRRVEKKAHRLFTRSDIDALCNAAFGTRTNDKGATVPVTKNARQFVDYIRLLAYTGAREQEAIKLRWADVDFAGRQIT